MEPSPLVGIVGSAGGFGRWLSRFFSEQMGLAVLGCDPADPQATAPDELIARCQVLVFAAPCRHSAALIRDYAALAADRAAAQLWLDVTSIKVEPVAAMLASQAEVVGLHPMTAPPKAPTLRGRVLVVCRARLERWNEWFARLLAALEANCVETDPATHDQHMAIVQGMVHAGRLAAAASMRSTLDQEVHPRALWPFRSPSFEMELAMMSRILSSSGAVYEDIQFGNPHVRAAVSRLHHSLGALLALLDRGDETARGEFRRDFIQAQREWFGHETLAAGDYAFERIGYLLFDLAQTQELSVHLFNDAPGALRHLLALFEGSKINIASLHSSRNPSGEVHFRFGFDQRTPAESVRGVAQQIESSGIGRVVR